MNDPTPTEAADLSASDVRLLVRKCKRMQASLERSEGLKEAALNAMMPLLDEIQRLQALHVPRDTRKGQYPEEGQEILARFNGAWLHIVWTGPSTAHLWLPAPPAPEMSNGKS